MNEETKKEVLDTLYHRPPYLQIESYEEIQGETITVKKTLQPDTFYFKGHFPGAPVVPGAMMCEMIFQTSCLLLTKLHPEDEKKGMAIGVLTKIRDAKFRSFLRPHDSITIKVKVISKVGDHFQMEGLISKDEKTVALVKFNCANIESSSLLH